MQTILLMGVSGGQWLPLLGLMCLPMAMYLGMEWVVNYIEAWYLKQHDVHKHV